MINLDEILDELYHEMKNQTGVAQIVLGNEDIPPDQMVYPRIKMAFIVNYNPQSQQSVIRSEELIDYDPDYWEEEDKEFDYDVEFTYILNPEATLSITAYGENIDEYIGKARDWFWVRQKGERFFNKYSCEIKSIEATNNRQTFIETAYEDRKGFDVILGFNEKIKVRQRTLEEVEINKEV